MAATRHLVAIRPGPGNERLRHLSTYLRAAGELREQATAKETLRAYWADWARFERWCAHELAPLPSSPDVLAPYLAEAASEPGLRPGQRWRYSPATLERWAAGTAWAHERAGHQSPTKGREVRGLLAGLRRARSIPPKRKAPVLLSDLEAMLATFETSGWAAAVAGARNRFRLGPPYGLHEDTRQPLLPLGTAGSRQVGA